MTTYSEKENSTFTTRWERKRKNKWKFIVLRGIIGLAIPLWLVTFGLYFLFDHESIFILYNRWFFSLIVFCGVGIGMGGSVWSFNERRYFQIKGIRKYIDKEFFEKWEKQRENKWKFILKHGIVYWSIPTLVLYKSLTYLWMPFELHKFLDNLLFEIVLWSLMGLPIGWFVWKESESRFKKMKEIST